MCDRWRYHILILCELQSRQYRKYLNQSVEERLYLFFRESKTNGKDFELWENIGTPATSVGFLIPAFIIKHSRWMTNKSRYWVVCFCAGFLQRVLFSGKTHNCAKIWVVVTSFEFSYGITLGILQFVFSSLFSAVLFKKSSFPNQLGLFSLGIRPTKVKIRMFDWFVHVTGQNFLIVPLLAYREPSQSRHGRVWSSRIHLSILASYYRVFIN